MVLDEELFSLGVDPFESVRAIAVHVAVTIGGASVTHQDSDLMESLRGVRPEIEGHVGVLDALGRVSLLAMDEVRELDWVLDEEDRGVVSDHVIVAFFGIVLDGKTARVTIAIICSTFSSNGRETQEDGGALADGVHEGSFAESIARSQRIFKVKINSGFRLNWMAQIDFCLLKKQFWPQEQRAKKHFGRLKWSDLPGHIVLNLNVTVSTSALSVDSSLGNSLTSEMG